MNNPHGILGTALFMGHSGMETECLECLAFAACLPSASKGMFWSRDSFGCCGSHRKCGNCSQGVDQGDLTVLLHIPGGSWGWLLLLGREKCSCTEAPQRFGLCCFANRVCVTVADTTVPHRKMYLQMNSPLQKLRRKVVSLPRQWGRSCVVWLELIRLLDTPSPW